MGFLSSYIPPIITALSIICMIVLGLLVYKHLLLLLTIPFMSPVSESIEAYLTESTPTKTHFFQNR